MIRLWGDPMDLYPLRSLGLPKGEQFIERLWVPTVALDYSVGLFLKEVLMSVYEIDSLEI